MQGRNIEKIKSKNAPRKRADHTRRERQVRRDDKQSNFKEERNEEDE